MLKDSAVIPEILACARMTVLGWWDGAVEKTGGLGGRIVVELLDRKNHDDPYPSPQRFSSLLASKGTRDIRDALKE